MVCGRVMAIMNADYNALIAKESGQVFNHYRGAVNTGVILELQRSAHFFLAPLPLTRLTLP